MIEAPWRGAGRAGEEGGPMRRVWTFVGALLLLVAAASTPAMALVEPLCPVEVSASRIPAGGSVTLSGDFSPDADLTLTVIAPNGTRTESTVRAGADGSASVSVRLERPGRYALRLVLPDSECGDEVFVTVTGAPDTATSDGSTSRPDQGTGIVVAIGSLLGLVAGMRLSRRSRSASIRA
jgi:hypothetical protein